MSNIHDHELDDEEDQLQGRIKPVCKTCGGYGYNFNTEHGNATICPSCGGDKRSRDPKDYKDRKDMPPRPK